MLSLRVSWMLFDRACYKSFSGSKLLYSFTSCGDTKSDCKDILTLVRPVSQLCSQEHIEIENILKSPN